MSSSYVNIWKELTYNCPECNINFVVLEFHLSPFSFSSSSSTPEIIHSPQCNTVASFISSTLCGVGSDDDYESDDESDDYESDDESDDSVTSIQTVEISSSMLSGSSSDGSNLTCSICLEDFVVGESAMKLPCDHLFHSDCINPWLTTRNSCPLCRSELPDDTSEDDNELTLEDVLAPWNDLEGDNQSVDD